MLHPHGIVLPSKNPQKQPGRETLLPLIEAQAGLLTSLSETSQGPRPGTPFNGRPSVPPTNHGSLAASPPPPARGVPEEHLLTLSGSPGGGRASSWARGSCETPVTLVSDSGLGPLQDVLMWLLALSLCPEQKPPGLPLPEEP